VSSNSPVKIRVSLYFDYICPFCYIGSVRLERLAGRHPLSIRWRFIEIHPDNPPEGRPLSELGYPPQQWAQMQANLRAMAEEEEIPLAERSFTTNSRRALLLAQATLDQRSRSFLPLHRRIFRAYFVEQLNIGDPEVLTQLARELGVDDLIEEAWSSPKYVGMLLKHVEAAQGVGLTGVPALEVGKRLFTGAVSMQTLEHALQQHGSGMD
jgi:predicted DsbA family dithiol-disulfide isomerase